MKNIYKRDLFQLLAMFGLCYRCLMQLKAFPTCMTKKGFYRGSLFLSLYNRYSFSISSMVKPVISAMKSDGCPLAFIF